MYSYLCVSVNVGDAEPIGYSGVKGGYIRAGSVLTDFNDFNTKFLITKTENTIVFARKM